MNNSNWNRRLFLVINNQAGKHLLLDRAMRFCAHDLLYLHVFVALLWAVGVLSHVSIPAFLLYMKLLLTAVALGYTASWLLALVFPHFRPIKELKHVTQLLSPLGTWKSFPSDHTLASFTVALVTILFGIPLWFSVLLLVSALLVSVARVYVGVHYPRDILGGVLFAFFFSLTSPWWLDRVTEPLYTVFRLLFL